MTWTSKNYFFGRISVTVNAELIESGWNIADAKEKKKDEQDDDEEDDDE